MENYEQRKEGFSLEDLPQTFKDAIVICKKLGVRYIWISAICTIQNDKMEEEQEVGAKRAVSQRIRVG
jgi:hypothetical protein